MPLHFDAKPAKKNADAKIAEQALRTLRSSATFVFKIPYPCVSPTSS